MRTRSSLPGGHVGLSLLALALTLSLGWLGQRFSSAIDLTANARHSLTDGTRNALAAFDGPVTITAVLGPDARVRDAVTALVVRYRAIKPDLALEFVNPDTDPARARALNAAPGGELIVRAGEREQRLRQLDERSLTGALRMLGRDGKRMLGFVTGHGERAPAGGGNDDWGTIAARLAAIGIQSRELSFVSEPRVPEEIDVLVIAAPRSPWFPGEIAGAIDFLRAGGNLLWLIETPTGYHDAPPDAAALSSDAPSLAAAVATGPGLGALATELGIVTLPGRVIDTASQALVQDAPDFIVLNAHPAHPVTDGLSQPVLLPQAMALDITPLAGQQVVPLLVTPESSWTEIGELSGEVRFDEADGETAGPLVLGAAIERERGADRPTQRIVVIGDADVGASRFLGNGSNAALIESLFVWLVGDDEALAFATHAAPDAQLELSSRHIVILSVALLLVVPAALLLAAIGVRLAMRRGG